MKIDFLENQVTTALAGAGVLLLVLVATELLFFNESGRDSKSLPSEEDVALPSTTQPVYVPPPIDNFSEILERPLFFSDRKLPPEPVAATVAAAPKLPLLLHLEGVAITSESRVAVLRNAGNNELLQLTEGMSHEGWILESVTPNGATFKRGEQVTELLLDASNGPRRR